ncbi:phage major capsid protein [Nocardia sp. NPDC127526]|uniref:phage major capsid protein n=1 Tax=Nocardia sp. NPDC127526 TaxID=3345393 RepID=UPI00363A76B4
MADTSIVAGDKVSQILPKETATEVIKEVAQASAVLTRGRRIPMSTREKVMPVLAGLPAVGWVKGEYGLKGITDIAFEGLNISAAELASVLPIPDAVADDLGIDVWGEVRPSTVEAVGTAFDRAVLFGGAKDVDFPQEWTDNKQTGLVAEAVKAGNVVREKTGEDLGVTVANAAQKLAQQGFQTTGFISAPGLRWELSKARDKNGQPIFDPNANTLYGMPISEALNGAWGDDVTMIVGDFSKLLVGVRQDITMQVFDSGALSDAAGKIVLNLIQQDSKALRTVFRGGFQVANPVTALKAKKAERFPFVVIAKDGVKLPGETK